MLFVCYPRCTTCAKARTWLEAHGLDYTERNIKLDNPTASELRTWHTASNLPLKRFFNTSGIPYRELSIKDKLPTLSEDEQFDVLASNGMLVKRPILVGDKGPVLVGFREDEWRAALL